MYCPNPNRQYAKKGTNTKQIDSTIFFTAADIQWLSAAERCEGPLSFWQTTIQIHRPECNHFAFLTVLHFHIYDRGRKKVTYHVLDFTFLKQVCRKANTQWLCSAQMYGETNVMITSFMFLRQGTYFRLHLFTFYTFLLFTLEVERLTLNDCVPPQCVATTQGWGREAGNVQADNSIIFM